MERYARLACVCAVCTCCQAARAETPSIDWLNTSIDFEITQSLSEDAVTRGSTLTLQTAREPGPWGDRNPGYVARRNVIPDRVMQGLRLFNAATQALLDHTVSFEIQF